MIESLDITGLYPFQSPNGPKIAIIAQLRNSKEELARRFEEEKSRQGWLGNVWDWTKNNLGTSGEDKEWYDPRKWWSVLVNRDAGSNKVGKDIAGIDAKIAELEQLANSGNDAAFVKKYKELTGKELNLNDISGEKNLLEGSKVDERVNNYSESQEIGVDVIADIGSGLFSFGCYAVAAAGILAAPVTGGASLAVTGAAIAGAGVIGSGVKTVIKGTDAISGGREYTSDDLLYDASTGFISGVLAPITAGIGGVIGKTVASRLGIEVAKEGTARLATSSAKSAIARPFLNFGQRYVGGTATKRAAAVTAEMAVDGTIGGSLDNTARHVIRTGGFEGAGKAFVHGAIGGAILAPVIGGGMRGIGRAVKSAEDLGVDIVVARDLARQDLQNIPETGTKSLLDMVDAKAVESIIKNADEITSDKSIRTFLGSLAGRLNKRGQDVKYYLSDQETRLQMILEDTGIGPSKIIQTLSSDSSLPKTVKDMFARLRSSTTPSRSLREAQGLADELYGPGKYILQRRLGSATIGEAYLADFNRQKVVIKMIKEDVTPERLIEERDAFIAAARHFYNDPKEADFQVRTIESMYKGWMEELDLNIEAQGARNLAAGAKRFDVAQPIEVGNRAGRGISVVYEMAPGIEMDKLIKMLKVYKENPQEYFERFKDRIARHEWLAEPEKWMKDLPSTYARAENEQFMFTSKGGRTIHGDPHAGNVFINLDPKTNKLRVTYIDTGLTMQRTNKEIVNDLAMSFNIMTGNSRGIARQLVENADISAGTSREELINKFASLLDERLFKAGINLKDSQYNGKVINSILNELGIVSSSKDGVMIKAAIQRILTLNELKEVTGSLINPKDNLLDLSRGLRGAFLRDPVATTRTVLPAFKYIGNNRVDAFRTLFQIFYKEPVQVPEISPLPLELPA